MKRITVGIMGTGIGGIMHLPSFQASRYFKVLGIYGRNKNKTIKIANRSKIKYYATADEMIKDEKIDLISIATVPKLHYKYARLAAAHGKQVILEKPMCLNVKEATSLGRLFRKNKLFNAIVHEHRFDPSKAYLKSIIETKLLGDVRSVEINKFMSYWKDAQRGRRFYWYSIKTAGGGVTFSLLSHQIDWLMYLFDDIKFRFGYSFTECEQRIDSKGLFKIQSADDTCWCGLDLMYNKKQIPCLVNISASRTKKSDLIRVNFDRGEFLIFNQNKIKILNNSGKILKNTIPAKFKLKNINQDKRVDSFVSLLANYYLYYFKKKTKKITDFTDGVKIQKILKQMKTC